MNNPIHIDMALVDKTTAKQVEILAKEASAPGAKGVYARMCIASLAPFSRQFAVEINLGTPVEQVEASLALMVAGMAATIYGSLRGPGEEEKWDPPDFIRLLSLIEDHFVRITGDEMEATTYEVTPTPSGCA